MDPADGRSGTPFLFKLGRHDGKGKSPLLFRHHIAFHVSPAVDFKNSDSTTQHPELSTRPFSPFGYNTVAGTFGGVPTKRNLAVGSLSGSEPWIQEVSRAPAVLPRTSAVAGLRGFTTGGVVWDASISVGAHETDLFIINTVNASLGPDTPTDFNLGSNRQQEMGRFFRQLLLSSDGSPRWRRIGSLSKQTKGMPPDL